MATLTDPRIDDYRERITAGMAAAIIDTGYARVTVSDIVRHARISKRTFYELFPDKEACLLALYRGLSARILADVEAALREAPRDESRVAIAVSAYLASLQRSPGLVRTLFVEVLHVGETGLVVRREVMEWFVALILREIEDAGRRTANSPAIATAIAGGINELILLAVEEGRVERLHELAPAVSELVRAFVSHSPAAP